MSAEWLTNGVYRVYRYPPGSAAGLLPQTQATIDWRGRRCDLLNRIAGYSQLELAYGE